MPNQDQARNWFFWVAAALSLLTLVALSTALVIGLDGGIRATRTARMDVVLYTLVALHFWLLGALIALSKPGETMIRVGFAAAIGTTLQLAARALDPVLGDLAPPEFAFSRLLFLTSPLHFAFAFEFFYRFPAGPIPGRLWSMLRAILWSFAFTVWAIRVPRIWAWAFGGPTLNDTWVWPLEQTALVSLSVAIAAAMIVNYRRLPGPGQRRRLQWIVAGVAAATLPPILLGLLNASGFGVGLDHPVTRAVELTAVLLPLTMIYAILRHRTLGLQVILRQSLQYVMAKSMLRLLIASPIVILAMDLVIHRDQTLSQLLANNFAPPLFAAAAAMGLYRRERLSTWLDRRFFREAHDREQLLVQLVEEMRKLDSLEQAPRLIVSTIESALHPSVVRLFVRDRRTGGFTLAHSAADFSTTLNNVPAAAKIADVLARERTAVNASSLPPEEAAWMDAQQAILAIPIASEASLAGMLLLGEKRSEEPYTVRDRELLASIASQVGVIYDNERLKQSLDEKQRVQRNVLARLGASEINLVKECPVCGDCADATERVCKRDGVELTLAVPVERVVEGRYRLDRRLGRGGMGTVYLAFDQRLHRSVAVKVLMGSLFGNRTAIRRFEREAQSTARLNHPNIVAVYDYGTIGSDGAYLVMEFVPGKTWRSALQQYGMFSPSVAANRMDRLIEGVKAAHDVGLVHRDLKPENIIIVAGDEIAGEQIKILDFGLAKLARDMSETSELTVAGAMLGTAGYMSHEQLSGEEADERSDIFSLGVIAAEAVMGRRPFSGRTIAELASAMWQSDWNLPADRGLRAVLVRCLARDPKDRFATAAQLQQELIPAIRACPPVQNEVTGGDDAAPTLSIQS